MNDTLRPSSRMLNTAHALLRSRVPFGPVADAENTNSLESAHEYVNGMSHGQCGEFIRGMKDQPKREKKARRTLKPMVGPGVYNLDGIGPIYRVRDVRVGHMIAEVLIDGAFFAEPGALSLLLPEDRLDLEDAKGWGREHGRCCVCGHALRSEESRALGISPECANKKEYWS